MKQNKFSKLENNYYYGISRVFWHIIVGLGSLAIIGGIAVLVWSQIPASERKTVKEEAPLKINYPEPVAVTLDEIKRLLPKGDELIKQKDEVTQINEVTNHEPKKERIYRDTVGLSFFYAQINNLKKILPISENKALWQGEGKYVMSARDAKIYKKTKDNSLKRWVKTSEGFETRFIESTDKNFKSYSDKAKLLSSYNNLLKSVANNNRVAFLNSKLFSFHRYRNDLQKSISTVDTISKILSLVNSTEQVSAFDILEKFIRNNPNDGFGLVNFEQSILNKFQKNQRLNIIKTINNEYLNNYDNQLSLIIDNTEQFIPMSSNFKGDQQPVALKYFYRLFKNKNGDRDYQIREIDNAYNAKLANIEADYQKNLVQAKVDLALKKEKKMKMKSLSYKSMAYGLGVVLLISLILLVLSMIRNVNRLAEAILQNKNKLN